MLRNLVGGWSLERKSLLFFGVALVLPIGLAFWFVLEMVAERLVMQTTRQAARDYARAAVAWQHVEKMENETVSPVADSSSMLMTREALTALRKHLVNNPEYPKPTFLSLEDRQSYQHLGKASTPTSPEERRLLEQLQAEYHSLLVERQELADQQSETSSEDPSLAESLRLYDQELAQLYRDGSSLNPNFPVPDAPDPPEEGWYVYYHVIRFQASCTDCHTRFQAADPESEPFRAVRVLVPNDQTEVASTATLAAMIAIAIGTLAATLIVVHWVLRKLVLTPLQHLTNVSDEIGKGNTDLRANLDTGDEFHLLAESFNRMLVSLRDGRVELEKLNSELDLRVDQLAHANFNLYEANRLKSDFLANMSHELRTPLNSIIGFSDVLGEIPQLSDKQKKYASNIQTSGKLLLEMINEILDLAKIEAGKMQVSPCTFDLCDLVSAQCDLLRPLVDDKNVDLHVLCDDKIEDVFQDRGKLQQILTNLLSNAIKFTPDGGVITVHTGQHSQGRVEVMVEDTGVGIPETDFEIIFEKFRQSDAVLQNDGLTRQYAGTGLGLSIVKELCKLLGGEIRLKSQLGTGSTFSVIIPSHYEAGDVKELIGESA